MRLKLRPARPWLLWAPVYVCSAVMALLQTRPCRYPGSRCLHPYWLEFWLQGYEGGFRRRGLLGTVVQALSPGHLNVVTANVVAAIACLGLLGTLVVVCYRRAPGFWPRAAVAVLLASPLTAVFFEVLGDPLQVAFLIFLVGATLLVRWADSMPGRLCTAAGALAAVLIHEAAIFLLLPAMVLLAAPAARPGAKHLGAVVLLGGILLAAVLLLGGVAPGMPAPTYHAVDPATGTTLPHFQEPLPGLAQLIRKEGRTYFSSPNAVLLFALKFPRSWVMPVLGLLLMMGVAASRDERAAVWRCWLFLSACSAPLYVIAHDWGRFSALTFWLTILLLMLRRSPDAGPAAPDPPDWSALPPAPVTFGVIGSLMLFANAIHPLYRYQGMPSRSLLVLPILGLAWLGWRRSTHRPPPGNPR